jgi:hypothetical protein
LPADAAVEENLRDLGKEIRGDLEATREAVKDAKVKERWSLLAIGAPMSLPIGMAVASGPSAVVATIEGSGAIALGITRWLTQKRLTTSGPESPYLLSLDAALRSPWQGLRRALTNLVHR